MSGERIYHKKNFIIARAGRGFVVYNTKKGFKGGHTHINNYNVAKTVVNLSINKKLPKSKSTYIVESLIRLTRDTKYKEELERYLADLTNK